MTGGFLGRLGTDRRRPDESSAIVEHLEVLLNARLGESVTAPDFGLPDFTDIVHKIPEGVDEIEGSIRDVIAKYEPRLCKIKVRYVASEDPFRLYFEVSARHSEDRSKPFRVRTQMGPGGRFEVGT